MLENSVVNSDVNSDVNSVSLMIFSKSAKFTSGYVLYKVDLYLKRVDRPVK